MSDFCHHIKTKHGLSDTEQNRVTFIQDIAASTVKEKFHKTKGDHDLCSEVASVSLCTHIRSSFATHNTDNSDVSNDLILT